jgi:hypothetical protein
MTDTLRPMTVDEVRAAATPVQELPPFDNGQPFRARLRRASLITLLMGGKIPNDLLAVAHAAMEKGLSPTNFDPADLPKLGALLETMCAATLVEPAWEDVKDLLDDVQIQAIMSYGTAGAKALEPFRQRPAESVANSGDGESLGSPTE